MIISIKYFLIWGLIILNCTFSYSQYLTDKKVDWKSIETHVSDSVKLNYIKRLVGNKYADIGYLYRTSNYVSKQAADDFFKNEVAKYHLINLNGDSLLDMIYEGRIPVGIELNDIVIFINYQDSLRIAFKVMGSIEKIKILKNKLISLQTIVSPCCCGFAFYRDYYGFNSLSNLKTELLKNGSYTDYSYSAYYNSDLLKSKFLASEALGYYSLPKLDNMNEEFISTQSFYLTINPSKIVNQDKPERANCIYTMNGNNQVAKFSSNTKGIILGEQKSKDSVIYAFIKIKNNSSIQSIFGDKDCYIYGWTELEKIKCRVGKGESHP